MGTPKTWATREGDTVVLHVETESFYLKFPQTLEEARSLSLEMGMAAISEEERNAISVLENAIQASA